MPLLSQGVTDAGSVRTHNEDRILLNDDLGLYVVCDGIGGRRKGELAAEIASSAIAHYVESSRNPMEVTWPYGFNLQLSLAANRLLTAAKLANRQVWRRSEESLECLGMGTTVVAILIDGTEAAAVNIGDSRAYLYRGGVLRQISVDDTIAGSSSTGWFTLDDAVYPQMRNVLTRAAGSQENVDVHLTQLQLEDGDRLLLCSDGLHGCLAENRICEMLDAADNPGAAVTKLLAAALTSGAVDNVSALIAEFRADQ
jgi:PPM family protein phosphatase